VDKSRAKDDEGKITKAEMTQKKDEVICPLVFKVTSRMTDETSGLSKANATNYDLTWLTTVQLDESGPGCWRSAPMLQLNEEGKKILEETGSYMQLKDEHVATKKGVKQWRSYALEFYKELERMRNEGLITWEENAWYFTHEAGQKKLGEFLQMVLDGKARAHKVSWENRFGKMVDLSWEDLKAKHPDIYGGAKKAQPEAEEAEMSDEGQIQQIAAPSLDDEDGPSGDELTQIEETEPELQEQPDEVAAATATETPIAEIEKLREEDEEDDGDDRAVVTVFVDSSKERIDTTAESVVWKGSDGDDHQAFLIELEDGSEYWLELGDHDVNGRQYRVKLGDE